MEYDKTILTGFISKRYDITSTDYSRQYDAFCRWYRILRKCSSPLKIVMGHFIFSVAILFMFWVLSDEYPKITFTEFQIYCTLILFLSYFLYFFFDYIYKSHKNLSYFTFFLQIHGHVDTSCPQYKTIIYSDRQKMRDAMKILKFTYMNMNRLPVLMLRVAAALCMIFCYVVVLCDVYDIYKYRKFIF